MRNKALRLLFMVSLLAVGLWRFTAPAWAVPGHEQGEHIFVALSGQNCFAVLNSSTYAVERYVNTDNCPEELIMNPEGSAVFVSNKGAKTVQVFSTLDWKLLARFQVAGKPGGLTLDPAKKTLTVSEVEGNRVTIIDLEDKLDALVGRYNRNWPEYVRKYLASIRITGKIVFAGFRFNIPERYRTKVLPKRERAERFRGPVTASIAARLEIGNTNTFVGIDDKSKRLYVAKSKNNQLLYYIDLPERPSMILNDGTGRYVFAALPENNKLYVVDLKMRMAVKKLPTGNRPLRLLPVKFAGKHHILVMNTDDDVLTLVDVRSQKVLKSIFVGKKPLGAFFRPPVS